MRYVERLHELGDDAERLEEVYHNALNDNDAVAFEAAVEASFAEQPANLLYAAWHYRLAYAARAVTARRSVAWALAICLALANGLVFWLLSDTKRFRLQVGSESYLFTLIVVWAPIAAIFVLGFLSQAGRRAWRLAAILAAGLVVLALYPLLTYPLLNATVFQEQYIGLALIHVPVLAWAAVGMLLVVAQARSGQPLRFPFQVVGSVCPGRAVCRRVGIGYSHHDGPISGIGHHDGGMGAVALCGRWLGHDPGIGGSHRL